MEESNVGRALNPILQANNSVFDARLEYVYEGDIPLPLA